MIGRRGCVVAAGAADTGREPVAGAGDRARHHAARRGHAPWFGPGCVTDARLLYWWFRLSGKDRGIKAGNYEIPRHQPHALLQKLVRGEALRAVTLVEAGTSASAPGLAARAAQTDTADWTMPTSWPAHAGLAAEGRFFPIPTPTPRAAAIWPCCRALHAMDDVWKPPGRSAPAGYAAQVRRPGAGPRQHRRERKPACASDRARSPACSPTACAWACCCRPTHGDLRPGRSLTATCAGATCKADTPGTPTPAPACRPPRSPCRAAPLMPPCSRRKPGRCTLWRAATVPATSANRWTNTTAPSIATNAGRNKCKAVHHLRGIDGAGKSSHIDTLAGPARRRAPVTVTREPGGTPLAEKLRAMLLHDAMDALTETLLVFAARSTICAW